MSITEGAQPSAHSNTHAKSMTKSTEPKWHYSEEVKEAMVLFLGQEPQQTNLYIITDSVCSLPSCISNN